MKSLSISLIGVCLFLTLIDAVHGQNADKSFANAIERYKSNPLSDSTIAALLEYIEGWPEDTMRVEQAHFFLGVCYYRRALRATIETQKLQFLERALARFDSVSGPLIRHKAELMKLWALIEKSQLLDIDERMTQLISAISTIDTLIDRLENSPDLLYWQDYAEVMKNILRFDLGLLYLTEQNNKDLSRQQFLWTNSNIKDKSLSIKHRYLHALSNLWQTETLDKTQLQWRKQAADLLGKSVSDFRDVYPALALDVVKNDLIYGWFSTKLFLSIIEDDRRILDDPDSLLGGLSTSNSNLDEEHIRLLTAKIRLASGDFDSVKRKLLLDWDPMANFLKAWAEFLTKNYRASDSLFQQIFHDLQNVNSNWQYDVKAESFYRRIESIHLWTNDYFQNQFGKAIFLIWNNFDVYADTRYQRKINALNYAGRYYRDNEDPPVDLRRDVGLRLIEGGVLTNNLSKIDSGRALLDTNSFEYAILLTSGTHPQYQNAISIIDSLDLSDEVDYALGRIYYGQEKYQKAIEEFSILANKHSLDAFFYRGQSYERQYESEKTSKKKEEFQKLACSDYKKVLSRRSFSSDYFSRAGAAMENLGCMDSKEDVEQGSLEADTTVKAKSNARFLFDLLTDPKPIMAGYLADALEFILRHHEPLVRPKIYSILDIERLAAVGRQIRLVIESEKKPTIYVNGSPVDSGIIYDGRNKRYVWKSQIDQLKAPGEIDKISVLSGNEGLYNWHYEGTIATELEFEIHFRKALRFAALGNEKHVELHELHNVGFFKKKPIYLQSDFLVIEHNKVHLGGPGFDIASSDEKLYVTIPTKRQVVVINRAGSTYELKNFPSTKQEPGGKCEGFGGFRFPKGVAVSDHSQQKHTTRFIYVVDENRIVRLSKNGVCSKISEVPLLNPNYIVIDGNDIYVSDTGNRRIVKLSANLELLSIRSSQSSIESWKDRDTAFFPFGLALDRSFGYLYVSGLNGIIHKYDKNGFPLKEVFNIQEYHHVEDDTLMYPYPVILVGEGESSHLYLVDKAIHISDYQRRVKECNIIKIDASHDPSYKDSFVLK